MRLLVDTHVLLWWMAADPRLSARARDVFADPAVELAWSIASSWELAVKISIGRLSLERGLERFLGDAISAQGLVLRPITQSDCVRVAGLPPHHRDPFDRMLVAQAQADGVPILSADPKLALYDVGFVQASTD